LDVAVTVQSIGVVLGLALFTLGWLLSGHFEPWPAFQQQWLAAVGVAVVGLAASLVPGGRWQWPFAAILCLGLAAVPWIQWWCGQVVFLSDAALPSLYLVGLGLSVACGCNLARGEPVRWADSLMTALLVAATVSTALAALQWLHIEAQIPLDALAPGGRPYANLAQANHLATLLGIGLAATLYFFERRLLGPWVATLLAAWLALGLLMTQSRTGWLFVALLTIWWWYGRRYLRLRGVAIAALCACLILGAVTWTALNRSLLLPEPLSTLSERLDGGLRLNLLKAMIEAIERSPWVGWGWNQVSFGHMAVALEHDAGQRANQNAHSIVLDLPLWMGIPLAAVLLLLVGLWLLRQLRACNDGVHWSLLLALGAIGVHALTEYPLDYAYFLLSLGLLAGTLEPLAPQPRILIAPLWTYWVPWSAAAAMLVWVGVEYMKVEESTRQVRMVLAGIGLEHRSHVPPPDTVLLDQLREYHRFWITRARAGMTDPELAWMRDVTFRNPSHGAMLRYALALGLNGRPDEAGRMLVAICHIHQPRRCDEARESWHALQQQYPTLASMPVP
jgi:hypothetical protein